MQPFNFPKNPNMTVQTRKQPPAQRYPVPFGVTNKPTPTIPISQKIESGPFLEENKKVPFEVPHDSRHTNPFDENDVNLQTPETSFNMHTHGYNFEETPAGLIRGDSSQIHDENIHEDPRDIHHLGIGSNLPQQIQNPTGIVNNRSLPKKLSSPQKKNIRTRDDDEYVRMGSDDEEEGGVHDYEPEIRGGPHNNLPQRPEPQKVNQNTIHEAEQARINNTRNQYRNEIVDTDILLKVKRLELELAKEKQRADFLEAEQGKLIDENSELRRRTEELNARLDLAKKYDSSEKLSRKEEELERFKVELNRLIQENQIYENHARRVVDENSEYKRESETLIVSLQEEKRRLQSDIQTIKRDLENRVSSKIETVQERNRILESQLAELRQQVQILTEQLLMKNHTEQKMADVSGEIQSLVSNLSKVTVPTQGHSASLKSQQMQTSPMKFSPHHLQGTPIETQTHAIVQESQHSQTLPVAFQSEPRDQASAQSQTHQADSLSQHIQTSPFKYPPVNTQNVYTSPIKVNTPGETHSAEKLQASRKVISKTNPFMTSSQEPSQGTEIYESFVPVTQETEKHHYEQEQTHSFPDQQIETHFKTQYEQTENTQEMAETLPQQTTEIYQVTQEEQVHEERPPMFKPPMFHPPTQHHFEGPPTTQQNKPSPDLPKEGESVSGSGLMAPPKYKIPQRHVPKKPVGGFKPMSQSNQLFAEETQQQKSVEEPFKTSHIKSSPFSEETNQNLLSHFVTENQEHSQFAHEIQNQSFPEPQTQIFPREELAHHINPTIIEEPHHSTIQQNPPKTSVSDDHPPISSAFTKENEAIRGSNDSHSKITQGQANVFVNRPPLFNAHHAKPKTHKIGKNPFSESNEETPSVFNQIPTTTSSMVTDTNEEPPKHAFQPVHKTIPTRNPVQHQHQIFEEPKHHIEPNKQFYQQPEADVSSEAAENFFDQLGKGSIPPTETTQSNTFVNQSESTSFQTGQDYNWSQGQNFQQNTIRSEDSGVFAGGRGPEAVKVQATKAIPIKKKKGALPTNMFD